MRCQIDHGRYPLRETGYLPLILRGGADGFVVVQGYSGAEIDALKPGTQVQCVRDRGNGKPIVVIKHASAESYPGIAELWTDPIEFDACLFRIWGDAELALHFGVRGVRNRPVYPDAVPLDLDGEVDAAAVAKRSTAGESMPRAGAAVQTIGDSGIVDAILKRSANGTNGTH